MSHLSTPDDITVSDAQLMIFEEMQQLLGNRGIVPTHTHIAASGGLLHADKYMYSIGNRARTGLAYFGY